MSNDRILICAVCTLGIRPEMTVCITTIDSKENKLLSNRKLTVLGLKMLPAANGV